jgi:hypothetical protein
VCIAKVSATKAKTTKIETIAKIEAAIVEDLAVIAEDELRTKTATFKQTRLKVKAIQEKNLNEPIPEDDDFDPSPNSWQWASLERGPNICFNARP